MEAFKKQSLIEGNSGRQEKMENSNGRSALARFLRSHSWPRDSGLFPVSGPLVSGIHYLSRMPLPRLSFVPPCLHLPCTTWWTAQDILNQGMHFVTLQAYLQFTLPQSAASTLNSCSWEALWFYTQYFSLLFECSSSLITFLTSTPKMPFFITFIFIFFSYISNIY